MPCPLKVHRWGSGQHLVLCLHASGLSGFQWKRLADKLHSEFSFLAPDFLGCGQSPPPSSGIDFSYEEDLQAILALIDSLDKPVILLAHSYGGFIGLKSALARPHRIDALGFYEPVLWGGLASFRGLPIERVVLDFDPSMILLNQDLAGSETWLKGFIDYWNGPGSWAAMTAAQRQPMKAMAIKLFAEVREVILDPTPHTAYAALHQPTLLMHGTTSPAEVLTMKDILAQILPNAQSQCIPGGHMNPIRNPLPVNAHFELFLKRSATLS